MLSKLTVTHRMRRNIPRRMLRPTRHGLLWVRRAETTDENPERVAAVQRLTWVCLRAALHGRTRGRKESSLIISDRFAVLETAQRVTIR
jgi:hypothetical protein